MATQTLSVVANGDNGIDEGGVWVSDFLGIDSGVMMAFSFITTAQIPAGSTINPCYLRIYCTFDDTDGITANVGVEVSDPGEATAWSSGHLPSTATFYTETSTGSVNYAESTFFLGSADTGATNIADQIQALLNQFGTIEVGSRINIRVIHTAGDGGSAQFEVLSAAGTNHPTLFLDWTEGGGGEFSITAEQGSYTLTGQTVDLRATRRITANQGSYTLTGQTASLLAGGFISAETGSYTLLGSEALRDIEMNADQGDYTLNGQVVALIANPVLEALFGSYTLIGQAANLYVNTGAGDTDRAKNARRMFGFRLNR